MGCVSLPEGNDFNFRNLKNAKVDPMSIFFENILVFSCGFSISNLGFATSHVFGNLGTLINTLGCETMGNSFFFWWGGGGVKEQRVFLLLILY